MPKTTSAPKHDEALDQQLLGLLMMAIDEVPDEEQAAAKKAKGGPPKGWGKGPKAK
jgi:hypothetical protein